MDDYIGVIKLFPVTHIPKGYLRCDGQFLSIDEHQALFSVLTNSFGGDGKDFFSLPDLRRASPHQHLAYAVCIEGNYPIPERGASLDPSSM